MMFSLCFYRPKISSIARVLKFFSDRYLSSLRGLILIYSIKCVNSIAEKNFLLKKYFTKNVQRSIKNIEWSSCNHWNCFCLDKNINLNNALVNNQIHSTLLVRMDTKQSWTWVGVLKTWRKQRTL